MNKQPKHDGGARKPEPKTDGIIKRTSIKAIVIVVGILIVMSSIFLIYVTPATAALLCALALFLAWSSLSKLYFLRFQRAGMKLVHLGYLKPAQAEFEQSLAFFLENPWADLHRAVLMLDISEISYTEMALNNIAYCQCKLKDFDAAMVSYEKLQKRYPDSELAKTGFKNLEAARRRVAPTSVD